MNEHIKAKSFKEYIKEILVNGKPFTESEEAEYTATIENLYEEEGTKTEFNFFDN